MSNKEADFMKNVGKGLVTIIKELRSDESMMRLLLSEKEQPFLDTSITEELIRDKTSADKNILSPYPFNEMAMTEDISQLRVFSTNTYLANNNTISTTGLVFEILVPKSLWLIWDEEGEATVRPYEMSARILNVLMDKDLEGLGKLAFDGFSQISVGTSFEGIRLFAKYWTVERNGSEI